jgi:DNA polymerase
MDERRLILASLRHLIESERAAGVAFALRPPGEPAPARPAAAPAAVRPMPDVPAAAPTTPTPAPAPMPIPAVTAPLPPCPTDPAAALGAIAAEIAQCRRCGLCATRTNTVPGEGDHAAELMFVGEGPGADEDAQGRPFVGKAGELLTKMIEAMGFRREQVFIANVVKCRPPGNRVPEPDEIAACQPYLERQIAAVRPKVLCTLGNTPLRALMGDNTLGITRLRGQRLDWRGLPLIPTFHPAYLLRNPPAKKPCWDDLKVVLALLGRTPPPR